MILCISRDDEKKSSARDDEDDVVEISLSPMHLKASANPDMTRSQTNATTSLWPKYEVLSNDVEE
jgi:hypothetical protein